MTIVKKLRFDSALLTKKLLLDPDPSPGQVQNVGSAQRFIVARVGPFDLLAGDVVVVTGEMECTRPMPGDSPAEAGEPYTAWLWYNQQQPWEGPYAEDHNPAVVMQGVFRTAAADSLTSEFNLCKFHANNILQYEHHKSWERAGIDMPTADKLGRYYSLIASASCGKPGHPAGAYVRVDYAQMSAVQIRP